MKKSPGTLKLFSKSFIYYSVLVSALCIISCTDDTAINNKPPVVDSNIVLRVDSVVLNTSNTFYVEQIFNFSKKLSTAKFQYWGESNIPSINDPYIKLIFISDFGDSITFIQSGSNIDSIPNEINSIAYFVFGDSCSIVKTQLGVTDSISFPISPDKYIKLKNLKVYNY